MEYIPKTIENYSDFLEMSKRIIKEYTPENTKRSIDKSVKYILAWCEASGLKLHDMAVKNNVIAFIIQHVEQMPKYIEDYLVLNGFKKNFDPWKISTIMTRLYNLSTYFKLWDLKLPIDDKEILMLIRRLKQKNKERNKSKNSITREILLDMIATCKDDCVIDLRDKAMLLFAFCSGGRRRSEVSEAMIENLKKFDDDYVYKIEKSKTDQDGNGFFVPIKGIASKYLNKWLSTLNSHQGPIFRSIRKNGVINEQALTSQEINRIVKKRAQLAGYEKDYFSAHSLRYGFVTEGGKRNINIKDIMSMTGHKSLNVAMGYYQSASSINNPAACIV